jgi:hypothetical protein
LLILLLATTATILLWPSFHPEQAILKHYYWQVDVLIHSGYFFGLTLLIASLKLPVRPFFLFLGLSLFSIALELLQHFSSMRGVSWMDGVDNLVGIGLGFLSINQLNKLKTTH